jgi:hypothetical protein
VTTNSIESAFSLLKRGVIGRFHKLSGKHLHHYLAESENRFNQRTDAEVFIGTVHGVCLSQHPPLTIETKGHNIGENVEQLPAISDPVTVDVIGTTRVTLMLAITGPRHASPSHPPGSFGALPGPF